MPKFEPSLTRVSWEKVRVSDRSQGLVSEGGKSNEAVKPEEHRVEAGVVKANAKTSGGEKQDTAGKPLKAESGYVRMGRILKFVEPKEGRG